MLRRALARVALLGSLNRQEDDFVGNATGARNELDEHCPASTDGRPSLHVPLCIYCMVEKAADEFNRDHVIPEAFETFEENFVLTCVCTECNDFFGRTVELKFARDSVEGHDRTRLGIKDASTFRGLGKRSTTYVEFGADSPVPGALGYLVAPKEGQDLAVTLKPRVGFARSKDGPFEWRPLDAFTKADLISMGFQRDEAVFMQTEGEATLDEFRTALAAEGVTFTVQSQTPPPGGMAEVELVYNISRPELRALTKIAFNYLAAVAGPDVVRDSCFDKTRRFARYDEGKSPVTPPLRALGSPRRSHYVSVQGDGGRVVAHVSVLMRCRYYVVVLAPEGFGGAVSSAHMFDIDTKAVIPTMPIPLCEHD
jgi:hypothetical protein